MSPASRMRATLGIPALVAALAASAPALASGPFDPCPPYRQVTACGVVGPSVTRDSVSCPDGGGTVVYDWPTGYASLDYRGRVYGCDTLTVLGPPAGDPVELHFRARVLFEVDTTSVPTSGFDYEMWFPAPGEVIGWNEVVNPGDPPRLGDIVLDLALTRTAGTPFPMRWNVDGGAPPGHVMRLRTQWEIVGLPEGVTVTSVTGYAAGATPARAASWGRLKSIYR